MGCMRAVRDMSDAFRCAFVQDRENKIVGFQGGACLTVERYFFFFCTYLAGPDRNLAENLCASFHWCVKNVAVHCRFALAPIKSGTLRDFTCPCRHMTTSRRLPDLGPRS